jgi:hypothetical protein
VQVLTNLPEDVTTLPSEVLEDQAEVRDRYLSSLFRRWPALKGAELGELRRLYDERLRLAKSLGARRQRDSDGRSSHAERVK